MWFTRKRPVSGVVGDLAKTRGEHWRRLQARSGANWATGASHSAIVSAFVGRCDGFWRTAVRNEVRGWSRISAQVVTDREPFRAKGIGDLWLGCPLVVRARRKQLSEMAVARDEIANLTSRAAGDRQKTIGRAVNGRVRTGT